jgi:hypothetical protein
MPREAMWGRLTVGSICNGLAMKSRQYKIYNVISISYRILKNLSIFYERTYF